MCENSEFVCKNIIVKMYLIIVDSDHGTVLIVIILAVKSCQQKLWKAIRSSFTICGIIVCGTLINNVLQREMSYFMTILH